jgi:hypothetical protein
MRCVLNGAFPFTFPLVRRSGLIVRVVVGAGCENTNEPLQLCPGILLVNQHGTMLKERGQHGASWWRSVVMGRIEQM